MRVNTSCVSWGIYPEKLKENSGKRVQVHNSLRFISNCAAGL